jgi:hypothetical protein
MRSSHSLDLGAGASAHGTVCGRWAALSERRSCVHHEWSHGAWRSSARVPTVEWLRGKKTQQSP